MRYGSFDKKFGKQPFPAYSILKQPNASWRAIYLVTKVKN